MEKSNVIPLFKNEQELKAEKLRKIRKIRSRFADDKDFFDQLVEVGAYKEVIESKGKK